jgi:hypothetical protein
MYSCASCQLIALSRCLVTYRFILIVFLTRCECPCTEIHAADLDLVCEEEVKAKRLLRLQPCNSPIDI